LTTTETQISFAPVAASTGQPIQLAMQRLMLRGELLPVGARLYAYHLFRSQERHPLEVIYSFMLPRDAALRRFVVRGEKFSARSELKPVEEAIREYERGLSQGHLATLAREYRDGIVNLTLGNLRPGETVLVVLEIVAGVDVRDDGWRFRFPFTMAPCYHSKVRVAEVEPGVGEMELPEDAFADVILPQWHQDAHELHEVGFDLRITSAIALAGVASASHALDVRMHSDRQARVRLARGQDVPNRDLVLDVTTRPKFRGALAGQGQDGRLYFAAVVPSTEFGKPKIAPRRVVFVLDRSGSMSGAPIEQAVRACRSCLERLSPEDEFGIVTFDTVIESFEPTLVRATPEALERARDFLSGICAGGGTEILAGIKAGVRLIHQGGDLFLVTDGQVFGTEDVIDWAARLGIRVHCLGIGSASQDRFLALLSRHTGGISRFVTPGERVDLAAKELFDSARQPVASQIRVHARGMDDAQFAPEPPREIYAGRPLVVFGEASGAQEARLEIQWDEGPEARQILVELPVTPNGMGETLRLLQGARRITDFEARMTEPETSGVAGRRQAQNAKAMLEQLSRRYGLASRAMALVAVVQREGDQPDVIPETRVVPVGMPEGVQFGSYFAEAHLEACYVDVARELQEQSVPRLPAFSETSSRGVLFARESRWLHRQMRRVAILRQELVDLLEDAEQRNPARTETGRALLIAIVLLALLERLNRHYFWFFRFLPEDVKRRVNFLRNLVPRLPRERRDVIQTVLDRVDQGQPVPGPWLEIVKGGACDWDKGTWKDQDLWEFIAQALNA